LFDTEEVYHGDKARDIVTDDSNKQEEDSMDTKLDTTTLKEENSQSRWKEEAPELTDCLPNLKERLAQYRKHGLRNLELSTNQTEPQKSTTQCEDDTLRVMKERGLPLTLEKWLSMNYGPEVTLDDLGPELRAQIPKELLGDEDEVE